MKTVKFLLSLLFVLSPLALVAEEGGSSSLPADYCKWEVTGYAINAPLCGLKGDAANGKLVMLDGHKGNCLACHQLPVDGVEAYGTIAPPLARIANRMTEGQLRLRVVDSRNLNPMSIMPGFYRDPSLINRPAKEYAGKTFLTAQEVEDVIAYLVTLK